MSYEEWQRQKSKGMEWTRNAWSCRGGGGKKMTKWPQHQFLCLNSDPIGVLWASTGRAQGEECICCCPYILNDHNEEEIARLRGRGTRLWRQTWTQTHLFSPTLTCRQTGLTWPCRHTLTASKNKSLPMTFQDFKHTLALKMRAPLACIQYTIISVWEHLAFGTKKKITTVNSFICTSHSIKGPKTNICFYV